MKTSTITTPAQPVPFTKGPMDYASRSNGHIRIFAKSKHITSLFIAEKTPEITEGDARLLTAAFNSYTAHCADPVAAAEADLLGEALKSLKSVLALAETLADKKKPNQKQYIWDVAQARAILAKAGK